MAFLGRSMCRSFWGVGVHVAFAMELGGMEMWCAYRTMVCCDVHHMFIIPLAWNRSTLKREWGVSAARGKRESSDDYLIW